MNRLGAEAVARVGQLVKLEGGGTVPRIYVWSQVTPNIGATPRKVAAELRFMRDAEDELLSEILAKLPDAERIFSVEPTPKAAEATKANPAKAKPTNAKPAKAKPAATSAKPKAAKAKPKAAKPAKPTATKAKPKAAKSAKPTAV